MKATLVVRKLHVKFHSMGRELHAVRGIDFCMHEGETVGIVGESGCGKSATAKAIMQLNSRYSTTDEGEILYKNENLLKFSEKKMRSIRGKEIGMIFQDPMTSLNPTMKVGSQIMEGYLRHFPDASSRQAREAALDIMAKVGIPHPEERLDSYPHTLSGGMRQRINIAIALAVAPKILLADEPTTALDVTIQAQILTVLKKIQEETGTCILFITHDMGVVAKMCDRVIVMYAGQIVESGDVFEIFSNPQHPYTMRLLASTARLDQPKEKPLLSIEGQPPNLSYPPEGCGFCARCPDAMRICALKPPPLIETKSGHFNACFKYYSRGDL